MPTSFELKVRSRGGDYLVRIGDSIFAGLLDDGYDVLLADRYFAARLEGSGIPTVFVDAEEENKTLGYAEHLLVACFEVGARRGSRLLAVGGGVVQDLATLVASLYMRGLPWSYAPTTLMAMADSCIGGKSSINAGQVKNLVGNIYPPRAITVDPAFLRTLGEAELVAGLSEAVKICFCRGPSSFAAYLDLWRRYDRDPADAAPLLHHVLTAKQWFVEVDEFDQKERRLLNFGHTFGHALESATSFAVNHGVGVALGMLCAVNLAASRSSDGEPSRLLAEHSRTLLGRLPDLRAQLAGLDDTAFERAFRADKKHGDGRFRLILPAPQGGVEEVALASGIAEMTAVRRALAATLAEVGA